MSDMCVIVGLIGIVIIIGACSIYILGELSEIKECLEAIRRLLGGEV